MTEEKKPLITKQEAGTYLEELETYLGTLSYEDETVLEKADKREQMIGDLMSDKAQEYYYNETIQETSQEKADQVINNINESIIDMERQLKLYKQTTSPKEAYFNIINERALKNMTPYVQYAAMYVYDVIKNIYDEENFKYITVRPSRDSRNTLPCAVMEFKRHCGWRVDDELGNSPRSFWFFSPGSTPKVLVSTLKKSPYPYSGFESTMEDVEKIRETLSTADAKKRKYKRRVFFLPHLKKRIDRNVETLIDRQKQRLINDYNRLTSDYSNMDSLSPEEEGREYDLVLEELVRMIDLLNDKLGLAIQTDM